MHDQPCENPPSDFCADLFGGCHLSANARKTYTRPVLKKGPWLNPAALRCKAERGLCGVVPSPAENFPNLVSISRGAVVGLDIFACRAPRSAVPKFFICESICALVGFAVGSALAPRERFASALRLFFKGPPLRLWAPIIFSFTGLGCRNFEIHVLAGGCCCYQYLDILCRRSSAVGCSGVAHTVARRSASFSHKADLSSPQVWTCACFLFHSTP